MMVRLCCILEVLPETMLTSCITSTPPGNCTVAFMALPLLYSTASLYITSYETLKDSLSEKYGKPSSDEVRKISSLAKYADADTALQLGLFCLPNYLEH